MGSRLDLEIPNSKTSARQFSSSESAGSSIIFQRGVRDLREMRNYVGKVIKWAEKQSRMIRAQKLPTYTW